MGARPWAASPALASRAPARSMEAAWYMEVAWPVARAALLPAAPSAASGSSAEASWAAAAPSLAAASAAVSAAGLLVVPALAGARRPCASSRPAPCSPCNGNMSAPAVAASTPRSPTALSVRGFGVGSWEQEIISVPVGWRCRPICIGLTLLLTLLVLLVLFLTGPTPSTEGPTNVSPFDCQDATNLTPEKIQACCEEEGLYCELTPTPTPLPPIPGGLPKSCLIWGDPHVLTFDGARADFLGQSESWIVKSSKVWIQGRFKATPFTNGLAATDAIAIGGPFLQGNKLIIPALNTGPITWNHRPILTDFPSSFDADGLGDIRYNDQGSLVDSAMNNIDRRIVHASLPENVHIQVMRWSHHVNVRITMPRQPGQDGCCGNFDGDISNDSADSIQARVGLMVPEDQLLFNTRIDYRPAPPPAPCTGAKRSNARARCQAERPGISGAELDACIFDVCVAGDRYAAQDAAM
mmetsp:Transcript_65864/g.190840  ORF Transcript_65864/g.190840 Transcript_65864/m.190840 type:complete len:467 (+) Transcript_65864:119-1519(+)